MNDISKEILSDIEQDKVMTFAKDKFLFETVKKYILAVACKHGTFKKDEPFKGNVNFALNLAWGACQGNGMPRSDEELGQSLRALTYAVQLVESGFNEIENFKKAENITSEIINPAE